MYGIEYFEMLKMRAGDKQGVGEIAELKRLSANYKKLENYTKNVMTTTFVMVAVSLLVTTVSLFGVFPLEVLGYLKIGTYFTLAMLASLVINEAFKFVVKANVKANTYFWAGVQDQIEREGVHARRRVMITKVKRSKEIHLIGLPTAYVMHKVVVSYGVAEETSYLLMRDNVRVQENAYMDCCETVFSGSRCLIPTRMLQNRRMS